jgi:hypothetical protein
MNAKERRRLRRALQNAPISAETKDTQTKTTDMKAESSPHRRREDLEFHTPQWLRISWQVMLNMAALLGLVTGYMAMIPRVSVSQSEPLDPDDIFSTPFIVSNDGPLPLETVNISCADFNVVYQQGTTLRSNPNDPGAAISDTSFNAPEVKPGERVSVPCALEQMLKPPSWIKVVSSDISIVVSFRIGYTPLPGRRKFRFVTFRSADNRLHWYPASVSQTAK